MNRRGNGSGRVLAGVMAVMVLSGCGSSSGGGAPKVQPAKVSIPAGFTRVGGTSYALGLPVGMTFTARPLVHQDGGKVVSSWFHDLGTTGKGPFCAVVASEQPKYLYKFPDNELTIFAAMPTHKVVRNQKLSPLPAGTMAAIVQESTATVKGSDGAPLQTRTFQRLYLTPGRTLITLSVAAPESSLASCDAAAIVATLQATGHEVIVGDGKA